MPPAKIAPTRFPARSPATGRRTSVRLHTADTTQGRAPPDGHRVELKTQTLTSTHLHSGFAALLNALNLSPGHDFSSKRQKAPIMHFIVFDLKQSNYSFKDV